MRITGSILIILFFVQCSGSNKLSQNKLLGTWDDRKGEILVFEANNVARWIFYTDKKKDTFHISYITDFSKTPIHLNLSGFTTGPLKGKTLYGIVEGGKNSITVDFEPEEAERPDALHPVQKQTYFRLPE